MRFAAGERRAPGDLPAAGVLVVERGAVAVLGGACSRRRMVVALAATGDLLSAPCGDQEVLALVDSHLRVVTVEELRTLLRDPAQAEWLLVGLVRALREREESLAQFANVAHAERLRRKLLQLARLHGTQVDGVVQVELPLTHALLAQMVGSARETVSTAIRALERDGFLTREGGCYRLRV